MMKISPDDMAFGSRSGIQKAIRRCDLDLAKTCFNILWKDKKHRSWLFWRAASLVTEEAWQMAGELAELLNSKSENEKVWRKFIYQLTLCTKNKDAVGLWHLTKISKKVPLAHPEFEEMTFFKNAMIGEDPSSVAGAVYDRCLEFELSAYEKAALNQVKRRTFMGGMLGDRLICLSGMLLIALRGIDKDEVIDDAKQGLQKWKKHVGENRNPITLKTLPWYVFDQHTQAGKIGKSIFMKHHADKFGLTEEDLLNVWFNLEGALLPRYSVNLAKKKDLDHLTCFQSAWWLPAKKQRSVFGGKSFAEVQKLWSTELRDEVKRCVEWIVNKRAENPRKK